MNDEEADETFQRKALEVTAPGPDFDPTRPPEDGDEFLTYVLYERQRCPAVVVAENTKKNVAKPQGTISLANFLQQNTMENTVHPNLLPTKEWKMLQVQDFLKMRNTIESYQQDAHTELFADAVNIPDQMSSSIWKKFCQANKPLLQTVLQIDNRSLEKLLEFIAGWLDEAATEIRLPQDDPSSENDMTDTATAAAVAIKSDTSSECDPPGTEEAEAKNPSSEFNLVEDHKWLGVWLYGTMSCLYRPLEPTVFSTLRNIARTCLNLRSRLQPHELEKAQPLNMFVCLIANVFEQFDFRDFI